MSLKAKIIPLIVAFGFVLVAGNALAFETVPSVPVSINNFKYDNSGKIYLETSLWDTSTYNQILFSDDAGWNATSQPIYFRTENGPTDFFLAQNDGSHIPWICDTTTDTYSGHTVWVIGTSPVKCYPTTLYTQYRWGSYANHWIYNATGITKTDIDNYYGSNWLENNFVVPKGTTTHQFQIATATNLSNLYNNNFYLTNTETIYFPLTGTIPLVEGVCGTGNGNNLTTIPPTGSEACQSGSMINFSIGYDELGTALNYVWLCEGSGGGSSSACASANVADPVAGVCGSANGQTISTAPLEYEMCDTGDSHGSLSQTLAGWTWSCYGFNGGSTASCSAIYGEAETPPDIPATADVPTPTDCDSFSGIDKVLCNFGNTIQGMFLPSSSKITELQTAVNKIGNIFPFNYLRAIGSIFTNASSITSGGLTMTIMGNTATLNSGFFSLPIIEKIKQFFTFMIYLAFIWWAIAYIKHFFK